MRYRIRLLLGREDILDVKTIQFSPDELSLQEAEALLTAWVEELLNKVRDYENDD